MISVEMPIRTSPVVSRKGRHLGRHLDAIPSSGELTTKGNEVCWHQTNRRRGASMSLRRHVAGLLTISILNRFLCLPREEPRP